MWDSFDIKPFSNCVQFSQFQARFLQSESFAICRIIRVFSLNRQSIKCLTPEGVCTHWKHFVEIIKIQEPHWKPVMNTYYITDNYRWFRPWEETFTWLQWSWVSYHQQGGKQYTTKIINDKKDRNSNSNTTKTGRNEKENRIDFWQFID